MGPCTVRPSALMAFSIYAHSPPGAQLRWEFLIKGFPGLPNKDKHPFICSCNTMWLFIHLLFPVAVLHIFLWWLDPRLFLPTRHRILWRRVSGFAHWYICHIWDIIISVLEISISCCGFHSLDLILPSVTHRTGLMLLYDDIFKYWAPWIFFPSYKSSVFSQLLLTVTSLRAGRMSYSSLYLQPPTQGFS